MTGPRVALVHDWLTGMRGGEKVLELMAERYPQAPIYTLFHFEGSVSEALESHPIHTSFVQKLPGLRTSYRHYLPLFPRAIESFDFEGFDLILSTSHCVAKGVEVPDGARHLCYCHTPMRYVWDQQRVYFPKSYSPMALVRDALLARLRRWDRRTAHRPTRYLANSTFVRNRIQRYYDRDAAVLHPPVDTEFFRPGEEPTERSHLLCVAALNAYKRVELAIEAAAELELPLIVVGGGPDHDRLRQVARWSGAEVSFRSGIEPEELRDLYRRAIAFVQPGIEDFGIASVEALACGTPVVAAREGGILDIVQRQEDGILFAPNGGLEALVEALRVAQSREVDRAAIARRAQRFGEAGFVDGLARAISELGFDDRRRDTPPT